VFHARCHDSGEAASIENAKLFKEDLLKRNVKNSTALNLQGLRLGINSMIALYNSIHFRKSIEKINLADNCITDYGMHSIKNIIANCQGKLQCLNLASNMISGEGMELFLDDLIANTSLKMLDLGVLESSMRKNSLGIQGAVCLSALLIRNKSLESLIINDNDFGSDGGECIGVALAQNNSLKVLKIAENDLKSEGAIPIISASQHLEILCLSKNYIKQDCGKHLQKLIKKSKCLKKLQLDFNELMVQGAQCIAQGLSRN
jgi:NLR family CARD domain-containing protein 3